MGNAWTLERARERSEGSKRPNTAYVERLNLHIRRSCAYLRRRTPAMQAGITTRPLALREIFSWIPPLRPYPPAVNWSPTPVRDDR